MVERGWLGWQKTPRLMLALVLVLAALRSGAVDGAAGWQALDLAEGWSAHPGGIALDGDAVHLALRHGRAGDWAGLAYAHCRGGCADPSSWVITTLLDEESGQSHPFIRVDAWGRPRVGFWNDGVLKYAACDVDCNQRQSWSITSIERVEQPDANGNYFYYIPDFELDAEGRPAFAYPYREHTSEGVAQLLKYASCEQACTSSEGWRTTTLSDVSLPATWIDQADLDFDATSPRIGYWAWDRTTNDRVIGYASCESQCSLDSNWRHVEVPEPFPNPFGIAFAVHLSRAHLVYANPATGLYYSTCPADCLAPTSWTSPALVWAHTQPSGARLDLTPDGHPRIAVLGIGPETADTGRGADSASENLSYLACDNLSLCATAAGWQAQRLDHTGLLVDPAAFALDGSRPRIAYSPWKDTDRVALTWCDSCGTAAPPRARPTPAPPETGPGGTEPTPTPTPTPTTASPTPDDPTEAPTTPPTDTPTSSSPTSRPRSGGGGAGGGGGGGTTGGGGASEGDSPSPAPTPRPQPSPRPPREPNEARDVRASDSGVRRTSGGDRVSTAAAISHEAFQPNVEWVFVANAYRFADALAAGPSAGLKGAPVLLVNRDAVPPATEQELRRLAPARIVVLGGPDAVAPQTEVLLATMSRHGTVRIGGNDRYATAAAISRIWFPDGVETVFIGSGIGFADALAGGTAAARSGGPLLLSAPDALPDSTRAELERLSPDRAVVLGGSAALSPRVEAQISALGIHTTRIAGSDRYGTTAAVTNSAFGSAQRLYVATGEDYPDALAAVAAATKLGAPLLLVTAETIPNAIRQELERLQPSSITLLGGSAAVTSAVEHELQHYIR